MQLRHNAQKTYKDGISRWAAPQSDPILDPVMAEASYVFFVAQGCLIEAVQRHVPRRCHRV